MADFPQAAQSSANYVRSAKADQAELTEDQALPLGSTLSSPNPMNRSRRRLLALGFGFVTGGLAFGLTQRSFAFSPWEGQAPRKGLLIRPSGLASLNTRTKIVLEVDGELRLEEPDPSKPDTIRRGEVKGKSTLDYFEKVAFQDSMPVAAARRYVEAGGENWISGSASRQELRPSCRETRMLRHQSTWQQFCPSESLDLREKELIESPINSAALELLLPTEPAKPTSKWTIGSETAQSIFNLEAVHQSSLTASVSKVEKGVATIALSGELDATANSVPTRLKLQGNFTAKLSGGNVAVTWLGLVIQEDRDISQSEPGFSVTARVRLIREITGNQLSVSDNSLRQLAEKEDPGRWLVRLTSTAGRYSMLADQSWHVYIDSGEETILRMVENNTVIAQCNVTRLPSMDDGTQLTLAGMQADIKQSLGEKFEQFLQSNEKVTSSGLRLIRSVAVGSAEDVPVQWIYNHLSDDSGRRMAVIFTMAGNLTDRFAAADEQMTSSFEFLPEPDASQPPSKSESGSTSRSASKSSSPNR